jgi:hypothetical protein
MFEDALVWHLKDNALFAMMMNILMNRFRNVKIVLKIVISNVNIILYYNKI